MRVFVLGSSGMLGGYVSKYLEQEGHSVVNVNRRNLDASKCTYLDIVGRGISFGDIVINCIGLIKQRGNVDELDFLLVNSVFPRILANACETVGAKFIHVTTDCVFTGSEGGYVESSPHLAMDIYGRSKSLGEPKNAMVIRTSIIGEERANHLSLVEWVKSQAGKTVKGFTNHYWNGITCLTFAKLCHLFINNKLFWEGTKHVYSPDVVSKYELINMISEVYALDIKVDAYSTNVKCDRSLNSERKDVLIEVLPLLQQIRDMKDFGLTN